MTPYLEIGGDYREVVPGIHLIELPLPFSLGLINVYLIDTGDGRLLVDTGMDTEPCLQALESALEGLGAGWADIRQVLLTHIHPDHMGLALKALERSGGRLLLHREDEALLAEIADREGYAEVQARVLRSADVPEPLINGIGQSVREVHRSFHRLHADVALSGGECIPTRHGPLEVISTPGHTPGHVCLYDRGRRILVSGDHILEHISPNIGWQAGRDALGEYLDSLDRVASLDVDVILPSHGSPVSGHREWVARTKQHHRERCEAILAGLSGAPRPANHLVPLLWPRHLSPFHHRFAVFELLAHLEYLARRGRCRAEFKNGLTLWIAD